MAHVSKTKKAELAPVIKAVLKKYKMKGTVSVRHHSVLVVKVSGGVLDFSDYLGSVENPRGYMDVNEFYINEHYADNVDIKNFLNELLAAMKGPEFFDHSDFMTDYFHCAHYINISIGSFEKPYKFQG
jgi:hypothetical protein